MSDHDRILEVLEHLDAYFSELGIRNPYVRSWSDGDKLRLIAYSYYAHTHTWMDLMDFEANTAVEEDLLRMAQRLDLLDEMEAK